MNVSLRSLAVVAAVSILLAGCSKTRSVRADAKDGKGAKAPDFTLQDSRGATVKLSDYKGKVVLLNFWATWCGPCKLEIPWFMDFQNTYKDKGFTVLGVSMDDDGWKVVKPYLASSKMNYPVVLGNDKLADS